MGVCEHDVLRARPRREDPLLAELPDFQGALACGAGEIEMCTLVDSASIDESLLADVSKREARRLPQAPPFTYPVRGRVRATLRPLVVAEYVLGS